MAPLEFTEIAQLLADRFEPVDGINHALPYEPVTAKGLPMVSVMFAGFSRAGLESPDVQGAPIRDPIGGRAWIANFDTRLWVALKTDEEAAQHKLQLLTKALVLALEADRSLGGLADDSAIASGRVQVIRPRAGNPLLMVTMPTQVEFTEPAG